MTGRWYRLKPNGTHKESPWHNTKCADWCNGIVFIEGRIMDRRGGFRRLTYHKLERISEAEATVAKLNGELML